MSSRDPDRKGMDTTGVVEYGAKLEHYDWEQTRGEVVCTITKKHWPKEYWDWDARPLKVQNLDIKLKLNELSVGIKGKEPFIKGTLFNRINTDDSTWTWDKETNVLEFTLSKDMTVHDSENPWWASLLKEDEKIDVDLIEGSKYLDVSLLRKIKAEKQRKIELEKKKKELDALEANLAGGVAANSTGADTASKEEQSK